MTHMSGMFFNATSFTADISAWDTSSVTDAERMFDGATAWLETYARTDGSNSTDGPPSAWFRIPSPPPPSPSLVREDDVSSSTRLSVLAIILVSMLRVL